MSNQSDAAAEAQQKLLNENRTMTVRAKSGKNTAILPGGQRVDATPYMHVRYDMGNQAAILGDPEKLLTDDWKHEHIGFKYSWPIRQSDQTSAFIRAGWYTPVPFEALDATNPMSAVAEIKTPGGRYVVWKSHILVAVSPAAWYEMVTKPEHMAIARTVNNAADIEQDLDRDARRHGYKAEVEAFTDQKKER